MRKIVRSHRQHLLLDDLSDNIASHTFRVALIAWFLAKKEGADPYKTVMMALLHDLGETRSGDQTWVHKRYVIVKDEEIIKEQLGFEPELESLMQEYEERETKEAKLVKDADLLDQRLLLKEYTHQGNKEAEKWLKGTTNYKRLWSETAKKLYQKITETDPATWWQDLWQTERKKE